MTVASSTVDIVAKAPIAINFPGERYSRAYSGRCKLT